MLRIQHMLIFHNKLDTRVFCKMIKKKHIIVNFSIKPYKTYLSAIELFNFENSFSVKFRVLSTIARNA